MTHIVELEVGSIYPICPIWTAPTAELSALCGRTGPLRATSSRSTTSAHAAVAGGAPKRTNAEVRATVAARHEDRIVANARQTQHMGSVAAFTRVWVRLLPDWRSDCFRGAPATAARHSICRARSNARPHRVSGVGGAPGLIQRSLARLIRAPWSPYAGDLSRSTGDLLRPRRWGSRSAAACADS